MLKKYIVFAYFISKLFNPNFVGFPTAIYFLQKEDWHDNSFKMHYR